LTFVLILKKWTKEGGKIYTRCTKYGVVLSLEKFADEKLKQLLENSHRKPLVIRGVRQALTGQCRAAPQTSKVLKTFEG